MLGLIREGDFIENDDDIDLLLHIRDRGKLLYKLNQLNIKITVNEVSIIQVMIENFGHVDIYFYEYRNTDILIRWDGNLLFSYNDIFPLKKVNFKGITINIPFNSEKVIEDTYGKNWRIPLKKDEYDWNLITNVRKI